MSRTPPARTFQELILRLQKFWTDEHDCVLAQPFDIEKGAGTYNTNTFLRALGPEPWKVAYVEPSRRPADGRYGDNPNRLYRHHQFQVVLKPNPPDVQGLYLESMRAIGIHPEEHDIRFVEDNWESPTLGASGLGWEVWVDGMELTQFTYFQLCGGLECRPVSAELTYGLERIAMYLQNVDNVYDVVYAPGIKYREVFHRDEVEYSRFTFEQLDVSMYQQIYELCEKECARLVEKELVIPAYDHLMKAAHAFNSLDARGAISVTERQGYILRIRDLAKACAEGYLQLRASLKFPLMAGGGTEDLSADEEEEVIDESPRGAPHKAELFVEIGSEELPAGEVMNAVRWVESKVVASLKELGIPHGAPRVYGTPRRIAVVIPDVPDRQDDRTVEHSGPPTKSGDTAATKFAEKLGLKLDQLQKRETKKGEYWFGVVAEKGKATISLLSKVVRDAIATIEFKRSMRWSSESETYSRPISWITVLFDGRRVPVTYAGVRSGRTSRGHRFLAPHEFKVDGAAQWEADLRLRKVIADPVKRREAIVEGARKLAAKAGGELREDESLLDEISQLVENPVPLLGHFDPRFLEIPDEVLISEMQHHQRYLPIVDAKGKLLPNFVVVANTTVVDEKVSLDGYRRVLTARFEDGAFFFKEDQKKPLASRIDALKTIRFHRDLGSVHDKVQRATEVARWLAQEVESKVDLGALSHAASLMKADLTTHMVFEFPELQGVIGAEYAARGGEPEEIATAIREHYLPRGAEDQLPTGDLGAILGMADRLDSIAGIFGIGKGPTGSADPFGLRRASNGIIAIVRHRGWHVSLSKAIESALRELGPLAKKERSAIIEEVSEFFRARLKGVATGEGVPTDVAEAVLSAGYDDLVDVLARAQALAQLKKSPDFEPIAVTFKRVANILKQAGEVSAADGSSFPGEPLFDAVERVAGIVRAATEARDFAKAFGAIAELRPAVADFFERVMVLDPDPAVRASRVALLARVQRLFAPLADFTKLS
jgi:glycyl-tRNA synthetase